MTDHDKSPYLSNLYRQISGGNPAVLNTVKRIAATAAQIDPSCPYGAHGVLGSLATYGFTPKEMAKFFQLCGQDVLLINAIDYSIFKKKLSLGELKEAMKRNFNAFYPKKYLEFAMRDSFSFSQYYQPKVSNKKQPAPRDI